MKILTYYTTNHTDGDLIPASVLAKGDSLKELLPELSCSVSEAIQCSDSTPTVETHEGISIKPNTKTILKAVKKGAWCIVLHGIVDGLEYKEVFTINDI